MECGYEEGLKNPEHVAHLRPNKHVFLGITSCMSKGIEKTLPSDKTLYCIAHKRAKYYVDTAQTVECGQQRTV